MVAAETRLQLCICDDFEVRLKASEVRIDNLEHSDEVRAQYLAKISEEMVRIRVELARLKLIVAPISAIAGALLFKIIGA